MGFIPGMSPGPWSIPDMPLELVSDGEPSADDDGLDASIRTVTTALATTRPTAETRMPRCR